MVMLSNLTNIFRVPELRKKLAYTLCVLAIFRLGHHIPLPGIDAEKLVQFVKGAAGGFLGTLEIVSGGALRKFAIFALGIGPYISASIMVQLLSMMLPSLEALSKEGEYGRQKLNQYTRYLTLGLAFVQGLSYAGVAEYSGLALNPGWAFRATSVLILCVGALFVMWLGEQITARGIGNGSSILIFASIVAGLPEAVTKLITELQRGLMAPGIGIFIAALTLGVIVAVIYLEKGERKIPVHYAKRVIGNRMYGGQSSFIPLKINSAGVIPVIFAGSLMSLPVIVINYLSKHIPWFTMMQDWFSSAHVIYNVGLGSLIIFFAYFWTAIMFNPVELAENMRKSGGFVPGIRPGKRTAEFFDYVLTRVGFPGAIYLAMLVLVPNLLGAFFRLPSAYIFSGTSILIVIGVALDTTAKIETHLIERRYEGFLSSGRLKGRRTN